MLSHDYLIAECSEALIGSLMSELVFNHLHVKELVSSVPRPLDRSETQLDKTSTLNEACLQIRTVILEK